MGMSTNQVLLLIGALVVGGAVVTGNVPGDVFSGVSPSDGDDSQVPIELKGESADASVKAKDAANSSSPDVAVTADLYDAKSSPEEFVASAQTNSDGTRKTITGLVVGDEGKVYFGVGDSGYYADVDPDSGSKLIDAKTERFTGNVYGAIGTGSVTQTFYDEDDSSTSSITIDSGETYTASRFRTKADAEDVAYNYEYMYFNTTKIDTELDEVRVEGAEEVTVPDKLSDDFSHAFRLNIAGDLTAGGEPSLMQFDNHETGQIDLDMESGKNPAGEIQICTDDAATFQNDNDEVQQGAEDHNDNDVGVAKVCKTITIS